MAAENQPKSKSKWRVVKRGILAFIGLVVALFFARGMICARECSRRPTCKNHLKQFGLAMHQYASEHDDKFPQGETAVELFSELIEAGYLKDGPMGPYDTCPVYVCPGAKHEVKAWKRTRNLTEETCSYEFVGGLKADSNPDFMVAFDKSADYHWTRVLRITLSGEKGRNVLFVDGHATWMREEAFQRRMSWQREMTNRLEQGGELIPFKEWREASKEEAIQ